MTTRKISDRVAPLHGDAVQPWRVLAEHMFVRMSDRQAPPPSDDEIRAFASRLNVLMSAPSRAPTREVVASWASSFMVAALGAGVLLLLGAASVALLRLVNVIA